MDGDLPRLVHVIADARFAGFLRGQLSFMAANGFDVHLVGPDASSLRIAAFSERCTLHELKIPRGISPRDDVVTFARLARLLRSLDPLIVHAHTTKVALLAIPAASCVGVPIRLYHNHAIAAIDQTGVKQRLLVYSERTITRLASAALYVSPSIRDAAIASRLCAPDKSRLVLSANGVDFKRFNPEARLSLRAQARRKFGIDDKAFVVAYVGRLAAHKGVEYLARAWTVIERERRNLVLLIAGEPDLVNPTSPETLRRLTRDSTVRLVGFQPDPRLAYAASDVVVLPSLREGLPYVLLEAAAMALPRVATRIPGTVDVVESGVNGFLVPSRDSTGLTEAICKYYDDGELRLLHGAAGHFFVMHSFTQAKVWNEVLELYRGLRAST